MPASATTKEVNASMSAALQFYSQKGINRRRGSTSSSGKFIDHDSISNANPCPHEDSSTSLSLDLSWSSRQAMKQKDGCPGTVSCNRNYDHSDSATELTEMSLSLSSLGCGSSRSSRDSYSSIGKFCTIEKDYDDLRREADNFLKDLSSTSDRIEHCDGPLDVSISSSISSKSTVSILRRSTFDSSRGSSYYRRSSSGKSVTFCLDEDVPEHRSFDNDPKKVSSDSSVETRQSQSLHSSDSGSIKIRLRRSSVSTASDAPVPDNDDNLEPSSSSHKESRASRKWSFSPANKFRRASSTCSDRAPIKIKRSSISATDDPLLPKDVDLEPSPSRNKGISKRWPFSQANNEKLSDQGEVLELPYNLRVPPDHDDELDPQPLNAGPVKIRFCRKSSSPTGTRTLRKEDESSVHLPDHDQLSISGHSNFRRSSSSPGRSGISRSPVPSSERNSDIAERQCSPSCTRSSSEATSSATSQQFGRDNHYDKHNVHIKRSSSGQHSHDCEAVFEHRNDFTADHWRDQRCVPSRRGHSEMNTNTLEKHAPPPPPPPPPPPKPPTKSRTEEMKDFTSEIRMRSAHSSRRASTDCAPPSRRMSMRATPEVTCEGSESKTAFRRSKSTGQNYGSQSQDVCSSLNRGTIPLPPPKFEVKSREIESNNSTTHQASHNQDLRTLDEPGSNLGEFSSAGLAADCSSRDIPSCQTKSDPQPRCEETKFNRVLSRALVIRDDDYFQALENHIGKIEFDKQLKRAVTQVLHEMSIENNIHVEPPQTTDLQLDCPSEDEEMSQDSNFSDEVETMPEHKPVYTRCRPPRRTSDESTEESHFETKKSSESCQQSGKRPVLSRRRSGSIYPC